MRFVSQVAFGNGPFPCPNALTSQLVVAVTVATRLIGGFLAVVVVGCSSSETSLEPNVSRIEVRTTNAPVVKAEAVSLEAKKQDSEAEFDSLQKLLAQFSSDDDGSFFGQPEKPKPKQSVAEVVRPQATIRLIGLLSSESIPTRALLKFDDALVYLSPGQQHDDIELVSIQQRSVQLRGRDGNWTVSLLDQPGLTDVAAANEFDRRKRDAVPSALPRAIDNESREFFSPPKLPMQDRLLAPQESSLGQPRASDMEDMFDLPELPNLAL